MISSEETVKEHKDIVIPPFAAMGNPLSFQFLPSHFQAKPSHKYWSVSLILFITNFMELSPS
jgi:hypothetical protein